MMKTRKRWLLSVLAAGSMITAIGCEAVGGVDLNEAVAAMNGVKSSEGTMKLEWSVEGKARDAETAAMMKAFGTGSIVLTNMLQEDAKTMSAAGELRLPLGDIPFELYMNGTELVLDVEGTKQPYVLDIGGSKGGSNAALPFDPAALADIGEDAGERLAEMVTGYVIGHVPNPANTKLGTSVETIDGVPKTLTSVAMETDLSELFGLLADTLDNIANDEAGLKALIGSLHDVLAPVLPRLMRMEGNPVVEGILANKEQVTEIFYSQFAPELSALAESLRLIANDEAPFSSDSGVTVELLLDGLKPAGIDIGVKLAPEEGEGDGLESIRFDLESRWWNANGGVKAKKFGGAAVPFNADAKPRERLANVEESSLLYDILRNKLRVTSHSFSMYLGENSNVPDGVSPYLKGAGTTMVPVRYVSEELDALVDWNGAAQTITITDKVDGVTIVMKIGEKTATVNGAATTLPEAPELIGSTNSTFVPIAFITRALGGKAEYTEGIVKITKEF